MAIRTMAVQVADWPVIAAGGPPHEPTAVVVANRVVACSPRARQEGVDLGQRRREAQGRCPALEVVERDESREARAFEAVLRAIESFTPRLELIRPGACVFPTRGPSRYFGGDRSLAVQVQAAVDAVLAERGWPGSTQVGVADGPFAAALAARAATPAVGAARPGPVPVVGERATQAQAVRDEVTRGPATRDRSTHERATSGQPTRDRSTHERGTQGQTTQGQTTRGPVVHEPGVVVVAPGAGPSFLAPLPIGVLARTELRTGHDRDVAELTDVFLRLGLATLGELAALPAPDVLARFGHPGAVAHRLAAGLDHRPPDTRDPPPDLEVSTELDPPAERVDLVAFVAKALADELFDQLGARGLSCTRVVIAAETEHGETSERAWRHEGVLTAGAVTDRVRWQVEGWLHAAPHLRPSGGVSHVRLIPDEVVAAHGRQLGFWGGETEADTRASRALARVQGLLGPDAVTVPEWRGRRGPGEQLVLVPAATVDLTAPRPATRPEWVTAPWPGRVPAPAPAVVPPAPVPVEVIDADGYPVTVSGRLLVSAAPARVVLADGPGFEVTAWAGPWPADERWWDEAARRRRARFQVVLEDGTAHLVTLEGGRWHLEATYD